MVMNMTPIAYGHLNTNPNTPSSMPISHPYSVYEDLPDPLDPSEILLFDKTCGHQSLSGRDYWTSYLPPTIVICILS